MPLRAISRKVSLYANKPEVARSLAQRKASWRMLKRAIANTVRMPDLARLMRKWRHDKVTPDQIAGSCMDCRTLGL